MSKAATLAALIGTRLPEALVTLIYTGRRETLGSRTMDPKAQARLSTHSTRTKRFPSVGASTLRSSGIASPASCRARALANDLQDTPFGRGLQRFDNAPQQTHSSVRAIAFIDDV